MATVLPPPYDQRPFPRNVFNQKKLISAVLRSWQHQISSYNVCQVAVSFWADLTLTTSEMPLLGQICGEHLDTAMFEPGKAHLSCH